MLFSSLKRLALTSVKPAEFLKIVNVRNGSLIRLSSSHSQMTTAAVQVNLPSLPSTSCSGVTYTQGQTIDSHRMYFYYIDHEGMLFLDDSRMKNFTSRIKDKDFLRFFFRRITSNNLLYKKEFPYLMMCRKERNFIRCDDTPLVYTELIVKDNKTLFSYNFGGEGLTDVFEPSKIYFNSSNGRMYHPAKAPYGGIGLINFRLVMKFYDNLIFENGESAPPTKFKWNGIVYGLDHDWYKPYLSVIRAK